MTEVFVPVIGYEGKYEVSNYGNVKSLPKGDGNGNRSRILLFDKSVHGSTSYRRVTFSENNIQKRVLVHRLVAEHFIPNIHNKPHVNHIDNNGENNHVSNLEWVTRFENMQHAQKQGRLFLAQSAGGKANFVSEDTAKERYKSLIGQKKGSVLITGIAGRRGLKNDYYLNARCDCGKEYEVNMASFNRGKATICKSCSLRLAHLKRKIDKDIVWSE